eukprot:m.142869 g.142869  ORF g.142869 m.142869 type:complete len:328 (-) comp14084_c0_seq4:4546-5529(-)
MNPMMGLSDLDALSSSLRSPEKGLEGAWGNDVLDTGMMVPDISMEDTSTGTQLEAEIDALVMATYGGPLIKQASRDNLLKLPAPLKQTDSFDSLIGILKALPDTDSPGKSDPFSLPASDAMPRDAVVPPVPAGGTSRMNPAHQSPFGQTPMSTEAFAPLSLSPSKLAAKVDALQKKLLGGGGLGPAESMQLGSFTYKFNSATAKRPLAEGQFSGVMPWNMTEGGPEPAAAGPGRSTLLPDKPPLIRGGSFTIKPKRRRVTTDADDAIELAADASGMEDPLIDTYLDICFFENGKEDTSTVLSIDHDEYADLIKAFEIDTADMPDKVQ